MRAFSARAARLLSTFRSAPPSTKARTVLQVSEAELARWCRQTVGLRAELASRYAKSLVDWGFDSGAALAFALPDDLSKMRIPTGHARLMISLAASLKASAPSAESAAPAPAAEELVEVSIDEARLTTAAALQRIGWDKQDAALQVEVK